MKKVISIALVFLLAIFSYSCYDFTSDMDVKEIRAFDKSGKVIVGSYLDGYVIEDEFYESEGVISLGYNAYGTSVHNLNSPAPSDVYYCITVKKGDSVTVEFLFNNRKNYSVKQYSFYKSCTTYENEYRHESDEREVIYSDDIYSSGTDATAIFTLENITDSITVIYLKDYNTGRKIHKFDLRPGDHKWGIVIKATD